LDNALKFAPRGSVVRLEVAPVEENGRAHFVRFTVHDQGPGVPLEERTRIFEKFSQVKGHQGRRRGSGLGLTFCKLVVEAHGGDIWAEEPPDGGSRFVLTLPVAEMSLSR
jgi:signal transduction histidine kinase